MLRSLLRFRTPLLQSSHSLSSSPLSTLPYLISHLPHRFPLSHSRTYATNKAAGQLNVGRIIGNRTVAPEKWHHIDAKGKVVGRLATEIVALLTGKHKPTYLPNIDSGDHVVITNARHIVFTGSKVTDKYYRWHTGYPGGLKKKSVREYLETQPNTVLVNAINGMLPKNRLRKMRMRKCRIFADEEHPHAAQLGGKLAANTPSVPTYTK